MKLKSVLLACVFVVPFAARAQEPEVAKPTSEEVRKVIEYFNAGKDSGPVLAALKPCLQVESKNKAAPNFLECSEPVTDKVKKGTIVNAWMLFLVPKDGKYEDLSVQWSCDGVVRTTQDLSLKNPMIGSRTWTAVTANKPGQWEIKVLQGTTELGSAKFTVE